MEVNRGRVVLGRVVRGGPLAHAHYLGKMRVSGQLGHSIRRRASKSMADAAISSGDVLKVIHQEIDECRICASSVQGLLKPASMKRGEAGKVMIVGKGPGRTEVQEGKAFSGPAGKKLEQWLSRCVPNPGEVRAGIYFTSVTKCLSPDPSFPILAKNCWKFLDRQIDAVRPALIISLGQEAYEALQVTDDSYAHAVCRLYDSSESMLFTRFGCHYKLMVWPHPSGLNRWLNEQSNMARLETSFEIVRSEMGVIS
ncbi:uracil-DNA glycosylase family protein [Tautonia plasticadhaerens]|uniref:Uracil DNA glycosylase superfamily protein n=1 Tax=Tautonia plasticadhaerens TaxID=2527974 RepID=A0A518H208_9BACT|nr:uracil-DNA glycosylase family protein [Tautonia plasticadhaerens]QDV34872.1 Uracil DNA glycosylase superfamily protein [Tautonia plasticadhaerens]